MASYAFETITPEEALALAPADVVTVTSGTASQATVLLDVDRTSVTIADRTVIFAGQPRLNGFLLAGPIAPFGRFSFADGSQLFIGGVFTDDAMAPGVEASRGSVYAGDGQDRIDLAGQWLVQGNQGDDMIRLSGGNATVYGGQGGDRVTLDVAGGNFVQGNKGDDSLMGSAGADTLLGGQGNDFVGGGLGGPDVLNGNLGDDLVAGSGQLFGEAGNDTITCGELRSTISGGDGNDRIGVGPPGPHVPPPTRAVLAMGDAGDDTIMARTEVGVTLFGGAGDDSITAGATFGGDILDGGEGNDWLEATGLSSTLQGGVGADVLKASNVYEGFDVLDGGPGADTLQGGLGRELFVMDDTTVGFAPIILPDFADRITEWERGDLIRLRAQVPFGAYSETASSDFLAMETLVRDTLGAGRVEVLAVQFGADVFVFADLRGGSFPDVYFILVGCTLADISADNFV